MILHHTTQEPTRRRARTIKVFALAGGVALSCGLAGPVNAEKGGAGWQGRFDFEVPVGKVDQFFHYACPPDFPVAVSGGFLPNAKAKLGMLLLSEGPRLDLTPTSYNEWSWIIVWPSGATLGSRIQFDVYCTKGPA